MCTDYDRKLLLQRTLNMLSDKMTALKRKLKQEYLYNIILGRNKEQNQNIQRI